MFKVIFTLDYEIHGNGQGSPIKLIVEPTDRILKLFNKYNAKLTIMADVAEILKFKDYYTDTGEDKFAYEKIVQQMHYAIKNNHDVQLHIHSGYFDSTYNGKEWIQNWEEYNLATLSYDVIFKRIKMCKEYLEDELQKSKKNYNCFAFRSANWSMMPTQNISKALINNNIRIDSSVFKWGKRNGRVKFDYSSAYDQLLPWFISQTDVNMSDSNGKLLEIPIYTELKYRYQFISLVRIYRAITSLIHKHSKTRIPINTTHNFNKNKNSIIKNMNKQIFKKIAWKLDFNQATGNQLIKALKNINLNYGNMGVPIPIVLIGHSKSFINLNEWQLKPLLEFISLSNNTFEFSTFDDLALETYRNMKEKPVIDYYEKG